MSNYKDLLGSSFHNLLKDTEADGQPVSWFMVDDYFYYSQGIALAMAEMLEAVTKEFHQELQKKNSHKLLEDAIHALHAASHLDPWVVTNGAKDGILANHRANMSTYIGEAEHVISTLHVPTGHQLGRARGPGLGAPPTAGISLKFPPLCFMVG